MKKVIVSIVIAAVALAGCASFEQHKLPAAQVFPGAHEHQQKPKVYVDVKFFTGNPSSASAAENSFGLNQIKPVIEKALGDSQMFSSYSTNPQDLLTADYTLQLYYYNHGNGGLAALSGFITGFSFFVIPGAATDNYTLKASVVKKDGSTATGLQNSDAVRTWFGIWFLPVAANTPKKAIDATIRNMTHDALNKLYQQQQLQLSSNH